MDSMDDMGSMATDEVPLRNVTVGSGGTAWKKKGMEWNGGIRSVMYYRR
jgi:hypothetical protein